MHLTRSQITTAIVVAVLIFVTLTTIKLYGAGYRLSFSHGFTSPSTLRLSHYENAWQLYIDDKLVTPGTPTEENATLETTIPAGNHDIVVMKDKFYPWAKTVDVKGGTTLELAPFHLPISTNGLVIPKTDAEYKTATVALAAMKVPTNEAPLVSSDGTIEAFVRKTETELGAELVVRVKDGKEVPQMFCNDSCPSEKVVTALSAEVRGVAFLPNRNDVILLAVQDGVFAIEIDNRGNHQNFQILYRGVRPSFALGAGVTYVQDETSIFKVYPSPGN